MGGPGTSCSKRCAPPGRSCGTRPASRAKPPRWPGTRCGWLRTLRQGCGRSPGRWPQPDGWMPMTPPRARCWPGLSNMMRRSRGGWRTRWAGGGGWRAKYRLLREVAGSAEVGSEGWCVAQSWLGWAAFISADPSAARGHFTAVLDAVGARGASRVLADALAGLPVVLLNTSRLAEGTEDGRRSLAMARELG